MLKTTAKLLLAASILSSATAGAFSADRVLKVGWVTELSGPWRFIGMSCLDAAQMAEKEVNAKGKRIELIIQDNQTNPATAATVTRQLDTQNKVDILSGPTNADTSLAVYGYAEENKIPLLVPVAAFPRLTRPGTRYTFRIEPDAVGWGYALIKLIKDTKPNAKVAFMFNDFAVNKATLAGLKYQAEKEGMKVVAEVMFPQTATDATVQAAQVRATRPDIIILSGGGGAFDATLMTQLMDVGFTPDQLWHPTGTVSSVLAWGPRAKGAYYGTFFDHNLPDLTMQGKKFIDEFRALKGRPPGYIENYCYVTVHLLAQLSNTEAEAGELRQKLRDAMSAIDTTEITTPLPIRFDKNGARIEYLYLMQTTDITKSDYTSTKRGYLEWSPEALPVYDLAP